MSDELQKQAAEASASSSPETPVPAEDFSTPVAAPAENAAALLEQLREQNRQLSDQLLRLRAEMDNARKRLAREKEEFQKYSLLEAVGTLLPILDGFELALAAEGGSEEYRKGVEIIYLQFLGTLQRLGLEPIEAKGKPFDPTLHEAIATVETQEVPENYVVDEMQRGFYFKRRLLRPAKVRVAKQPAPAMPAANPDA